MDDLCWHIPAYCKVGGCIQSVLHNIILKLQHFIKASEVIFLPNYRFGCYKYSINGIRSHCHAVIASFDHVKSKDVRFNSYSIFSKLVNFTLLFAIKLVGPPTQAIFSKNVSTSFLSVFVLDIFNPPIPHSDCKETKPQYVQIYIY